MKKILKLILFSLFFFMTYGKLYANYRCLIVGISDYENPAVPDIAGPLGDADKFYEIALLEGFRRDEMKVLKNEQATKENILYWMRRIASEATPQDAIAFLYSGHGTQVPDQNGDEQDGLDEAIVPYDAYSIDDVITDDEINEIFSSSKAGRRFYILDSCHSGTGYKGLSLGRNIRRNRSVVKYIPPSVLGAGYKSFNTSNSYKAINVEADNNLTYGGSKKVVFLAAAGANEVAYGDIGNLGASAFTYALYRGIIQKKADYNHDDYVTFGEARLYASYYVNDTLHKSQSPQLETNPENEVNLVVRNAALKAVYVTSGHPSQSNKITQQTIEEVFSLRNVKVNIESSKKRYHLGELLHFTIAMPMDGYLNVIAVEPNEEIHLLFPNDFARKNYFKANQIVHIPEDIGGFRLRAVEPTGKTIVYAFVTEVPMDIYSYMKQIVGSKEPLVPISNNGSIATGIRNIAVQSLYSYPVSTPSHHMPVNSPDRDFGAGKIEVRIIR